jgi:hypothetical protein
MWPGVDLLGSSSGNLLLKCRGARLDSVKLAARWLLVRHRSPRDQALPFVSNRT